MNDLISKREAITIPVMPKNYRKYQTMNIDDAYELGWYDCQECIKNLPSTRQEIIWCKDCKHKTGYLGGSVCDRFKGDVWIVDDDFCSYAERRADD